MGKLIHQIAESRGHKVNFIVSSKNKDFTAQDLKDHQIDAAIEFSLPEAASANIQKCIEAKVPVAIGTTGWYHDQDKIQKAVTENEGCILPATNFSLGVNIFFEINRKLAALMNSQNDYDVEVEEIHHTEKLDAPSGTGITTAEIILDELDRKSSWLNDAEVQPNELLIKSVREPNVPGTHIVKYESDIDKIELLHEAKNRNGFALGAVIAAEFIHNKKGIYSMQDVLQLN